MDCMEWDAAGYGNREVAEKSKNPTDRKDGWENVASCKLTW